MYFYIGVCVYPIAAPRCICTRIREHWCVNPALLLGLDSSYLSTPCMTDTATRVKLFSMYMTMTDLAKHHRNEMTHGAIHDVSPMPASIGMPDLQTSVIREGPARIHKLVKFNLDTMTPRSERVTAIRAEQSATQCSSQAGKLEPASPQRCASIRVCNTAPGYGSSSSPPY